MSGTLFNAIIVKTVETEVGFRVLHSNDKTNLAVAYLQENLANVDYLQDIGFKKGKPKLAVHKPLAFRKTRVSSA